jgi:hypothetical protein
MQTHTAESPLNCPQPGHTSSWGKPPALPLVEVVLGTVIGTQLPVVLQVVILHQLAQDVQELLKADLVVLVLVCCPKQL